MVLQTLFGSVPLHLRACVASVKDWAKVNDSAYVTITSPVEYFAEPAFESPLVRWLWYRHASDYIRTRILATTPNTLYVDWDVFLYPDFQIPDPDRMAFAKAQTLDAILYNGKDLAPWRVIHGQIEQPNFEDKYSLSRALRDYAKDNVVQTFQGHYCHFDNCAFKDTLDYDYR